MALSHHTYVIHTADSVTVNLASQAGHATDVVSTTTTLLLKAVHVSTFCSHLVSNLIPSKGIDLEPISFDPIHYTCNRFQQFYYMVFMMVENLKFFY